MIQADKKQCPESKHLIYPDDCPPCFGRKEHGDCYASDLIQPCELCEAESIKRMEQKCQND